MPISAVAEIARRKMVRDTAVVVSGVAAAQAVTIVFAPIVTRIYGPQAFGALGVFVACTTALTPLVGLAYPFAIVLPEKDSDALSLAKLSLLISVFIAAFVALALLFLKRPVEQFLSLHYVGLFVWFLPLALVCRVGLQVATQWVIRKKLFHVKAKAAVAQSLIINCSKTGIGLLYPVALVLIALAVAGTLLQALGLWIGARCSFTSISREGRSLYCLARQYKDFPVYRAPQDIISATSQGVPTLLLATFFGAPAAGFYVLGRQIVGLPSMLLARSVGDVFYPRFTEADRKGENRFGLIHRVTLALAAIGIIPFTLIFLIGPSLFSLVFGPQWSMAGEFARWLSLMLFFNFISRPSVAAIPALGLQRGLLIYEIFSTSCKISGLFIGFAVFKSDLIAVAAFSSAGAVSYIALIAWTLFAAHEADGRTIYEAKTG